ncbi:MAG: hypothetical protein KAR12_13765 [Methylococcales bacterium]|nr:hypothetical protein [Methylococcales bacterium]
MNSRVIKLLLGLCVLLLIILLVEWLAISFSETPAVKSLSAVEGHDMELPELVLTEQSIETYLDMVDRPLFIKGRKPVIDLNDDSDIQEFGKIEDLVLVGIYSKDGHMIALFSQQGSEKKYLKKSEGDDISGWLLKEIQADQIILEQAGEQQSIMLRKPKPKTKPKITTKRKPSPKPKPKPNPKPKPKPKPKPVSREPKKI